MRAFVEASVGFPTAVFTAALAVVVVFWLLVAAGVTDSDGFDADASLSAWGLGGVPVTVAVSFMTVLSWLLSLSASVLSSAVAFSGTVRFVAGAVALVAVPLFAWRVTRVAVRPFARFFPDEPGPSRQDFIGSVCSIRTGRVDADFGQAEVAARDGSTAVVQVRQYGTDSLSRGSTGLLYAYDDIGEFFWVAPYDAALDPQPHRD
ncbi:hypothetical protein [Streptomyces flavofungini]|uniref:hypothetical protein n=1 Tax=Streptomyces flavofungini TaxID=68200 RepID=UPI0025B051FD|nr:hypothetical protein [Streptomyces flavofungini]WJV48967.1 hypothetical protein QUY26_27700 [Streptomyces flavofungini]